MANNSKLHVDCMKSELKMSLKQELETIKTIYIKDLIGYCGRLTNPKQLLLFIIL